MTVEIAAVTHKQHNPSKLMVDDEESIDIRDGRVDALGCKLG